MPRGVSWNGNTWAPADSQLLGDQLARAQAAANILGRLTVLRDARRKTGASLRFASGSMLAAFASPVDPLAQQPDDAQQNVNVYTSFTLPQTGAVEYLRRLTPVTKTLFDGLSKQYQADAFTMAGVADQRLLKRVQDEITEIIAGGGTARDFQAVLDKLRSEPGSEAIGKIDVDGVFQGVSQRAYAAGRYEQMSDESVIEALPYRQYWTANDDRVRPAHRCLHLFCALAIDPVWLKIYPPCGYGCRCAVVSLGAEEAPKDSDQGGLLRLPILAIAQVPQPGFQGIFGVA